MTMYFDISNYTFFPSIEIKYSSIQSGFNSTMPIILLLDTIFFFFFESDTRPHRISWKNFNQWPKFSANFQKYFNFNIFIFMKTKYWQQKNHINHETMEKKLKKNVINTVFSAL